MKRKFTFQGAAVCIVSANDLRVGDRILNKKTKKFMSSISLSSIKDGLLRLECKDGTKLSFPVSRKARFVVFAGN